jgi:hypothetical protein
MERNGGVCCENAGTTGSSLGDWWQVQSDYFSVGTCSPGAALFSGSADTVLFLSTPSVLAVLFLPHAGAMQLVDLGEHWISGHAPSRLDASAVGCG